LGPRPRWGSLQRSLDQTSYLDLRGPTSNGIKGERREGKGGTGREGRVDRAGEEGEEKGQGRGGDGGRKKEVHPRFFTWIDATAVHRRIKF